MRTAAGCIPSGRREADSRLTIRLSPRAWPSHRRRTTLIRSFTSGRAATASRTVSVRPPPASSPALAGQELLHSVIGWVNQKLMYVTGSSLPTDGAVRTLLGRQGVCRDFAHLSIALLRALNVPARLAAVYAPGLSPMELHAVAEAFVDDAWWVVDATQRAPRQSLLRVATGRDAADTAFLTNVGPATTLKDLQVTAVVDQFELDKPDLLTQLR